MHVLTVIVNDLLIHFKHSSFCFYALSKPADLEVCNILSRLNNALFRDREAF